MNREPRWWQRFLAVTIDNPAWAVPGVALVVAGWGNLAFRDSMPPAAAAALMALGALTAVAVVAVNGGVLAGRGQSLGMAMTGLALVDVHRRVPVGTSRAFAYSLRNIARRTGNEPSPGERHAGAVLVHRWVPLDDGRLR